MIGARTTASDGEGLWFVMQWADLKEETLRGHPGLEGNNLAGLGEELSGRTTCRGRQVLAD
jgi:hypothetical protein